MISACWRQRPEDRPSIEEVLNHLEGIPSPNEEEEEADEVDNKEQDDTDYALRREQRKAELLALRLRCKQTLTAMLQARRAEERRKATEKMMEARVLGRIT